MSEGVNGHFDADSLDGIAERLMAVVADIQRLRGAMKEPVAVPRWLTVNQVVGMTPFGKSKVWELVSNGQLRSCKRGGRRLIAASDLEAFMAGEGGPSPAPRPAKRAPKSDPPPKARRSATTTEQVTEPPGRDLSSAELVWLQRLPLDPREVSEEDGLSLAWLAVELKPGSGDARLVESILKPVRALYMQPGRVSLNGRD